MSIVERLMEENAGLRERAEQAERALALCQMDRTAYAEQAAQAQTDLAGAEATAETLRLALAEAERERDASRADAQIIFRESSATINGLIDERDEAEQRGRALAGALTNLLGELSSLQIEAVRDGCGNTNAACLQRRVIEARAALTPPEGSAECRHETPPCGKFSREDKSVTHRVHMHTGDCTCGAVKGFKFVTPAEGSA